MSGFIGTKITDEACKIVATISIVLMIVSLAVSTLFVVLRILALWEHNRVRHQCDAPPLISADSRLYRRSSLA
jgi:hypothetical protein